MRITKAMRNHSGTEGSFCSYLGENLDGGWYFRVVALRKRRDWKA